MLFLLAVVVAIFRLLLPPCCLAFAATVPATDAAVSAVVAVVAVVAVAVVAAAAFCCDIYIYMHLVLLMMLCSLGISQPVIRIGDNLQSNKKT